LPERCTLTIRALQEAIKREYFERDSARGLFATFAWLVEELGELATSLLSGDREGVEEEIADVVAWTLSVANLAGVDVEDAVLKKYGSVVFKGSCSSS